MEQALRETDRKKDDFIALLDHELEIPSPRFGMACRSFAWPVAILAARRPAPATMMERQLSHMVRLIDDLLDRLTHQPQ